MYEPHAGLENLMLSWGHDEYMYQVLKHNKSTLPQHALNIIRFHSFYPWHSSGDYEHLMKPEDEETKKWVLTFKWVTFPRDFNGSVKRFDYLSPQPLRLVHEINEGSRYRRAVAVLSEPHRQIHSRRVGVVIQMYFILCIYRASALLSCTRFHRFINKQYEDNWGWNIEWELLAGCNQLIAHQFVINLFH